MARKENPLKQARAKVKSLDTAVDRSIGVGADTLRFHKMMRRAFERGKKMKRELKRKK